MNSPMTAAMTKLRNEPVPAKAMTPGTMMNTDDAGVVAESVRNNIPSTPRQRARGRGVGGNFPAGVANYSAASGNSGRPGAASLVNGRTAVSITGRVSIVLPLVSTLSASNRRAWVSTWLSRLPTKSL